VRDQGGELQLLDRHSAVGKLVSFGKRAEDLENAADSVLTLELSLALEGMCPKRADVDDIARALEAHKARRDKDVAHSEAVEPSALPGTTWAESLRLIDVAKRIVAIVGSQYLGIAYTDSTGAYLLTTDADMGSMALERLFVQAEIGKMAEPAV
jgi:hypothetical protein